MKTKRQEKILEIISNNNIETQEELISALRNEGYAATQATVSRDIRQLELSKLKMDNGTYKYVAPRGEYGVAEYKEALFSAIKDVRCALNNVVVKTGPGLAQAIAAGIDMLDDESILGSVAGDDTIIIVVTSELAGEKVKEKILKLAER